MKSLILATILIAPLGLTATPAIAGPNARVCTRDADGFVNIRAVIGLGSRITGRAYNGQTIPLSGWHGTQYQGFTWFQTSGGGWIRGDYLCAPQPQYGPGNFSY